MKRRDYERGCEMITVYPLRKLPHITGIDHKNYGYPDGFEKGQTMEIPKANAETLIKHGYVSLWIKESPTRDEQATV